MTARRPRYRVERVPGSAELQALQDRLGPVLDRLSRDADTNEDAAGNAALGSGTAYTPAVAADWNNDAPATVADALDRIAAMLGPIT